MATYISKHTGAEIDSILDSVGGKANSSDIPTSTSQLTNNSNFVVDANYVHTDNNYSNEEKQKLANTPLFVKLTQAEYDALVTKDENTIYCIKEV